MTKPELVKAIEKANDRQTRKAREPATDRPAYATTGPRGPDRSRAPASSRSPVPAARRLDVHGLRRGELVEQLRAVPEALAAAPARMRGAARRAAEDRVDLTVPTGSSRQARWAWLIDPVSTVAASPYGESAAQRSASVNESTTTTGATGPKVSSRTSGMSCRQSVTTVAG